MTPLRTGSDLLACELPALPPRAADTPTTSATSAAMKRYLIITPFSDRASRTGLMTAAILSTGASES
jgi:hypothetical protein